MCAPTKDTSTSKDNSKVKSENRNKLETAQQKLSKGILYGSLSLALLIGGYGICMPFYQSRRDDLQCDSLCYGSLTSTRSFLSLFGSALVGRLSDYGRKWCLIIGCMASFIGLFIDASTYSISGMYYSMIPGALLEQNFSVLKALFADYHSEIEDCMNQSVDDKGKEDSVRDEGKEGDERDEKRTTSDNPGLDRAGSVGKLGMSVGLSFMVGPFVGATFFKNYSQAVQFSMVCTVLSSVCVTFLPTPSHTSKSSSTSKTLGIFDFVNVKAARSPGAIFVMIMRVCMSLAYHIFATVWTTSLKERFNFGPTDHGRFMSFIGLTYALSQGFVAKSLIKYFGPSRKVRILMLCCIALGFGRCFVYFTKSLMLVYFFFGIIIIALGIVNTVLTADTSNLAPSKDIGGLYGALQSVESLAGIGGPIIGGFLATKVNPVIAPLASVVLLYSFVFVFIYWGYSIYVDPIGQAGKSVTGKSVIISEKQSITTKEKGQ